MVKLRCMVCIKCQWEVACTLSNGFWDIRMSMKYVALVCVDQSYFQLTMMWHLKQTLYLRHLLLICCHRHSAVTLSSCQHLGPLDCPHDVHNNLLPGCSIHLYWPRGLGCAYICMHLMIYLVSVWDIFEGQCHRTKFMVTGWINSVNGVKVNLGNQLWYHGRRADLNWKLENLRFLKLLLSSWYFLVYHIFLLR